MKAGRIFYFDAAHHLPDYCGKCEKTHGHTYRLEVVIEGKKQKNGMIMDFNKIKDIVNEAIIEKLDHADLNDLLDNPTAENIASWIFAELENKLPLHSIKLWEGEGKWVELVK